MEVLALEHVAGSVNETFAAALNEGEVPFVLVEARPLQHARNSQRAPFSLLFRNGSAFLSPQQTYQMRHARISRVVAMRS
ncbi:DUF6916 family protein [Xanthomonas citri]|uniref:DUF6916 family protein n=1 Tax=Xanthomonas citri TaxID=346 RepID=UPI000247D08B|nr:hypothetical protein [Xanthomonas citri]OOW77819.1 hypothetical protein Xvtw_04045 [Xanthomonas campestris pv. vitiswoodrowii]MBE0316972.1 hypothetical protein [Xanthomonas citri pv. punicae]MDS0759676.1 hypothetical protein [Xanthomonas citri pv. punicae]MDS0763452.1 hypothetical protein [Xanthomonas citri pv. punicae]MDS0798223.1 hypothetical protein [Xanthomonas citri pv. punicae]